MGIWTHVTGAVDLKDMPVCEDDLIAIYAKVASDIVGSEGGLNISFTRSSKQTFQDKNRKSFYVEPFTRLTQMVFQGDLRDFHEGQVEKALQAMKTFLEELIEHRFLRQATFVFRCDISETMYHVYTISDTVRIGEIKLFED